MYTGEYAEIEIVKWMQPHKGFCETAFPPLVNRTLGRFGDGLKDAFIGMSFISGVTGDVLEYSHHVAEEGDAGGRSLSGTCSRSTSSTSPPTLASKP